MGLLFPGLVAFALLVGVSVTTTSPVSGATIAPTTTCSNGVDNTPGLGLICEVAVANTITASGGSAAVTVRECHGAAGDPTASCSIVTSVLTEPVTAVTQCNDATNGGGGTLRCSVAVTNTFIGVSANVTAATVNQCVGSGDGITVGCVPFPATTTGATITQCNGSANGGTLVGLICTATGTQASAHGVTINQCNGSTNGGGALVICSASIENVEVASTPSPAPTASSPAPTASGAPGTPGTGGPPVFGAPSIVSLFPGLPGGVPELPNASMGEPIAPQVTATAPLLMAGLLLLAGLSLVTVSRRRTSDSMTGAAGVPIQPATLGTLPARRQGSPDLVVQP